jgi:hypothetical protein
MPDWSRRRALQAVATTGAFALAGCSGESSRSRSVPRERGEPVPTADLEVRFVRDTDGESLFGVDRGSDSIAAEDTETRRPEDPRPQRTYLTDADGRDRVTFREGTDLDSRSLFLLQRPLGECYEARLVGVYRETDGVDVDLCQALRPADVECSADTRDTIGVAVRLPFAGDSFSGYGTGWSSDCAHRSTVASEGGEER